MAKDFAAEQHFDATPEQVFEMFCDTDYITRKLQQSGGSDLSVSSTPTDDGGADLELGRSMPAKIPSFAKALISDPIVADERHHWGPAEADGSREGTFTASFQGAPVAVTGTMRLEADGDSTSNRITGSVKASVPFVGGKIEDLVRDQLTRFVRKEQQVGDHWLAAADS